MSPDATAPDITITRTFDGPRELVFKAWTEPARFVEWFGGRDVDGRQARRRVARDHGSRGRTRDPVAGRLREVVPPERLVFTLTERPGDEYEVVTVVLTDRDGRTEMLFQQAGGHMSKDEYARAKEGWGTFFDFMAENVAKG
jgi:uncharacterized protein YndB with AHSA1/START domain